MTDAGRGRAELVTVAASTPLGSRSNQVPFYSVMANMIKREMCKEQEGWIQQQMEAAATSGAKQVVTREPIRAA